MAFIEPLAMQTWFINVFAGNPEIFGAIAIMVISSMASFFRMTTLGLFMILSIFVLMFSGIIGASFLTLFAIIGGLIVGYALSQFFR